MCGINGIFNFDLKGDFAIAAERMSNSMNHRGPDSEGCYSEEGLAFAHKRLAIIELSPLGHQPMFFQNNRYVIIFNGEIYNFLEIKSELKEFNFISNSDTEVILASFVKWGKDCLNKFTGMFAFAIWDKQEKELFIARDRLGEKPLYYSIENNTIIFSSEIRSLVSSRLIKAQLSLDSLAEFLSYQSVHYPNTILNNVNFLEPGHFILAKRNAFNKVCYWNPSDKVNTEISKMPYTQICKNINSLLTKSVKQQMISDVPLGAFLSGGIDSSAIVGLMSQNSARAIKTFSIIFDENDYSEEVYAKSVARRFNTEHHEILITAKNLLEEIPYALDAMDHPSGDGPNTYSVSRATKTAGITVALSGLGGDEIFAGYPVFKRTYQLLKILHLNVIPCSIRLRLEKFINLKSSIINRKFAEIMRQKEVNFKSIYPISRKLFFKNDLNNISKVLCYNNSMEKEISNINLSNDYLLSSISIAELKTYMHDILLKDSDQMSMSSSLELRVPFLDYNLIEFVLSVPDKYKYPKSPKKLLIDSLNGLLPSSITNRKKMGFTFPWKKWLKNDLRQFCETYINQASKKHYYVDSEIKNLWNRFLNNDPLVSWAMIWNIVVIEYWLNKNSIE